MSSDSDGDIDLDSPIIEGDFVVVKCAGKSRTVNYIARVDTLNGEDFEFEGVFLQKVAGTKRVSMQKMLFTSCHSQIVWAVLSVVLASSCSAVTCHSSNFINLLSDTCAKLCVGSFAVINISTS